MNNPVYDMAINNIARHIRSVENKEHLVNGDSENHLDAFKASEILAIAFCKLKEDVILDIVRAQP